MDRAGEEPKAGSPQTHGEMLKQHELTDPGAHPELGVPWASPVLFALKINQGLLMGISVLSSLLPKPHHSEARDSDAISKAFRRKQKEKKKMIKEITVSENVL